MPQPYTVVKAIAATAATTLVVAGIIFYFFKKLVIAQRLKKNKVNTSFRREGVVTHEMKLGGNVKGLIVDENGMDVLYLRKLEDGQLKPSFPKVMFNPSYEDEEEKSVDVTLERPRKSKPQEVPLLCECSDANPLQAMKPTLQIPTPLTPRPPLPRLSQPPSPPMILEKQTQAPPQPPAKEIPVPPPPPPPPLIPGKISPAPPPPPPKAGGLVSSLKPPPAPRAKANNKSREEASMGKSLKGTGAGQMKLKPLHWDKVIANADHSMVWDEIIDGSFRYLCLNIFHFLNVLLSSNALP